MVFNVQSNYYVYDSFLIWLFVANLNYQMCNWENILKASANSLCVDLYSVLLLLFIIR